MSKTKIHLKQLEKGENYPRTLCCITKCNKLSDVIDATHKYSNKDLPLCDTHWIKLGGGDNDQDTKITSCTCNARFSQSANNSICNSNNRGIGETDHSQSDTRFRCTDKSKSS